MARRTYEYDIFLSYPFTGTIKDWVVDIKEMLAQKLEDEGLKGPRIFFDRKDLQTGDDWPKELRDAHLRSKVFVPVLCTPYFQSGWCTSEWVNAYDRASTEKKNLVFPIRFNDLEPSKRKKQIKDAKVRGQVNRVKFEDFGMYSTLFDMKDRSPEVREIWRKVEVLSKVLVPAIAAAPKWKAGWPVLPIQAVSGTDHCWQVGLTKGAP